MSVVMENVLHMLFDCQVATTGDVAAPATGTVHLSGSTPLVGVVQCVGVAGTFDVQNALISWPGA